MNLRLLFFPLLLASPLRAQSPPAQMVSVVAIGSTPRSVVKWDANGQNEYVLAEPKALPPSNLHVKVTKEDGSKFEPFTLTLNIPSQAVPAPAGGLPIFQSPGNGAPGEDATPLLVVPVAADVSRQMIMMYRDDPSKDWSKPEYFPMNLGDSRFPTGGVAFVNLSGGPVRVELPQTKGAMNLLHRQFVSAKAPAGEATLNYRISVAGPGNKLEAVAFTGLRSNPGQRQVVAIYRSNDKKTVCSSFALTGD